MNPEKNKMASGWNSFSVFYGGCHCSCVCVMPQAQTLQCVSLWNVCLSGAEMQGDLDSCLCQFEKEDKETSIVQWCVICLKASKPREVAHASVCKRFLRTAGFWAMGRDQSYALKTWSKQGETSKNCSLGWFFETLHFIRKI